MSNNMILAAGLAALLALPAGAQGQEKPKASGFAGFFQNLKKALEQSAVVGQRKKGRGAGVAAVRGDNQKSEMGDPNEPTLMGDAKSRLAKKQAAINAEFEKAVDLVLNEKYEDGLKALEAFQKKHPKSHKEDVEKAIAEVKTKLAEGAAPAAAE